MLNVCLNPLTCLLHWSSLPFVFSLSPSLSLSSYLVFGSSILCGLFPLSRPGPIPPFSLCVVFFFSLSLSFSPAVGSDLKDIQNNKHRYLIASENQRPGHFSTAPIGSLTASPSSGSLCSQVGLQSVTSIQERIMSTPGGEEAIERLKVQFGQCELRLAICPLTCCLGKQNSFYMFHESVLKKNSIISMYLFLQMSASC